MCVIKEKECFVKTVVLAEDGQSERLIAETLCSYQLSVARKLKRWKDAESTEDLPRIGRSRKSSSHHDHVLWNVSLTNRHQICSLNGLKCKYGCFECVSINFALKTSEHRPEWMEDEEKATADIVSKGALTGLSEGAPTLDCLTVAESHFSDESLFIIYYL